MYTLSEIYTVIFLGIMAYMTFWFGVAFIRGRRDVVDSAWGLGFIVIALVAYILRNNDHPLSLVTLLLVCIWGLRLSVHISLRNHKKREDYRYQELGQLGSLKAWVRTYVTVFLLQGVLMICVATPIVAIASSQNHPIPILGWIGAMIWLIGITIESVADYQLRTFLQSKPGKQAIMQQGIWRYSRHPNYFGESLTWTGAAIIAVAFGNWWGVLGAAVITVLVTKISGIPLLEKRYKTNTVYQAYAQKTSIFIPLPPKK